MKKKLLFLLIGVGLLSCQSENDDYNDLSITTECSTCNVEEAFPDKEKEIVVLSDGIEVEKVDGYYIYQGDILLSEEQVEKLKKPILKSAVLNSFVNYWPDGIVYYTIASNLTNTGRVTSAINHWQSNTNLRFIQRTNQSDYIEFRNGSGCSSFLGKKGGKQEIILEDACSTGNAIHEIGHAIGLFHEQSRADRDQNVIVHWNNIQSSKSSQFQTYIERNYQGFDIGNFDFGSIMLYSSNAFSKGENLPTMTRRDNGERFAGQRNSLSQGDIVGIQALYGPPYSRVEVTGSEVIFDYSTPSEEKWEILHTNYIYFYSDKTYNTRVTLQNPRRIHIVETIQWMDGQSIYERDILLPAGSSSYYLGDYEDEGLIEYGYTKYIKKRTAVVF